MISQRLCPGLLPVAAVLLSGCMGSGSGSLVVVEPQLAEGPVASGDFVGRTFPVLFLVGETGSPSARARAGTGAITYNGDGSVTLELPGTNPLTLTPASTGPNGTNYTGSTGSGTVEALIADFESTESFRVATSSALEFALFGGFGFETPQANRRARATYDTAGAVFLTTNNVSTFLPAVGSGRLEADFDRGTISGTLLETDPVFVELGGSVNSADDLAMTFLLRNGVITPEGFRGGVSAEAALQVDGFGGYEVLDVDVTGGMAEGRFFDENAEVVSTIFSGEADLSDDGGSLVDLEFNGFAAGAQTGP